MADYKKIATMSPLGRLGLRPRSIVMKFIDIHTHNDTSSCAILNSYCTYTPNAPAISLGIHPWHISTYSDEEFKNIAKCAHNDNVVAIGECGFDFVNSSAPKALQQQIFEAHAALAEETKKPLIIHLVKGQEQITAAAKKTSHSQAWIIHGFRGNPIQAKQMLSQEFYLSYGEKFNEESVLLTPLDRLFIETDESKEPIENIYARIAKIKGTTIEALCRQINENALRCNIRLF